VPSNLPCAALSMLHHFPASCLLPASCLMPVPCLLPPAPASCLLPPHASSCFLSLISIPNTIGRIASFIMPHHASCLLSRISAHVSCAITQRHPAPCWHLLSQSATAPCAMRLAVRRSTSMRSIHRHATLAQRGRHAPFARTIQSAITVGQ
jgi:hypothetical protein